MCTLALQSSLTLAMPGVVLALVLLSIVIYAGRSVWREYRRPIEMRRLAARLGMTWQTDTPRDLPRLTSLHSFRLDPFPARRHTLTDRRGDTRVWVFDEDYVVTANSVYPAGRLNPTVHRRTVIVVRRPEMHLLGFALRPEDPIERAMHAAGYQDIDFDDDPAFSDRFSLQGEESPTRDAFDARVRRHLLNGPNVCVDGWVNFVAVWTPNGRASAQEIERLIGHAVTLAELLDEAHTPQAAHA
ncbi:MAG: hypothetical protein GC159_16585 [Phycisphaera sp.]|nr:hypothetical protein [Phycisphaera sp.]